MGVGVGVEGAAVGGSDAGIAEDVVLAGTSPPADGSLPAEQAPSASTAIIPRTPRTITRTTLGRDGGRRARLS